MSEKPVQICATDLPEPLAADIAVDVAELFRALGDPNRLRIISLLMDGEHCVHDISAALDMGQSAVSHQMRVLRQLRLVRARKAGRHVFYTLIDDHIHALLKVALEHVTEG